MHSLTGKDQLEANFEETPSRLRKYYTHSFKFGIGVHQGLSTSLLDYHFQTRYLCRIETPVVPIDVRFLLGLDVFVKFCLVLHFLKRGERLRVYQDTTKK